MRILFVHKHFPGHYGHLVRALLARGDQVAFVAERIEGDIPGIQPLAYTPHRGPAPSAHPYIQGIEGAVIAGQAAFRVMQALARSGFRPDVVCAHAGFGPGLYVKDIFPKAAVIGHFEWFYRAEAADADFLDGPPSDDDRLRIRTRNAEILVELSGVDAATTPTRFQQAQFPDFLQSRLQVLHEGIDTDFYVPGVDRPPVAAPEADAFVTYATRGMEPYRGFPQAMAAFAEVLRRRPRTHLLVAGTDAVTYGRSRADGRSYRDVALEQHPILGGERVHWLGHLDPLRYRALLRASAAHVYLTVPFVLSWSFLEAMACAAPIVGSATGPVQDVMSDTHEGVMVNFFDVAALADAICALVENPERGRTLGAAARLRVEETFALKRLLPRHLDLLSKMNIGKD